MKVSKALKELHFKSVPSIARLLYKNGFRRGDRITVETFLRKSEVKALQQFKQSYR